jgi:hypothetical protein
MQQTDSTSPHHPDLLPMHAKHILPLCCREMPRPGSSRALAAPADCDSQCETPGSEWQQVTVAPNCLGSLLMIEVVHYLLST